MPQGSGGAASRAAGLERLAVALSFWLGGLGMVALKGMAYMATGSSLVRTSMFESLGDVFSSAIMAVTQRQMNNTRDADHYPVGKARLAPIGVLVFCAFMCSSMSNMALDSLQALLAPEEPDVAGIAAADAVRRLLSEKPRLRWAYGPGRSIEALAREYGERAGEDDASEGKGATSTQLLAICVGVKLCLWVFSRFVERLQGSEIVKALACDHRNDTLTNGVVVGTMELVSAAGRAGYEGAWLTKADPAVSLILSLWIVYGWILNALEQVKALSDRRAGDADFDVEAIRQAARDALQDAPLELRSADVYHAGEGFRVRLDLRPAAGEAGAGEECLAAKLSALRAAVQGAGAGAGGEVLSVDTCILSRAANSDASFAWVKDYRLHRRAGH